MSCWVVPTIAAEMWGVSVQHVLQCIQNGSVPASQQLGLTFVDVAPDSPTLESVANRAPAQHPTTNTPVVMSVHSEDPMHEHHAVPSPMMLDTDVSDEESDTMKIDWRSSRELASRQRRAPIAA